MVSIVSISSIIGILTGSILLIVFLGLPLCFLGSSVEDFEEIEILSSSLLIFLGLPLPFLGVISSFL
jgi:hypothetical protein